MAIDIKAEVVEVVAEVAVVATDLTRIDLDLEDVITVKKKGILLKIVQNLLRKGAPLNKELLSAIIVTRMDIWLGIVDHLEDLDRGIFIFLGSWGGVNYILI